MRIEEKIICLCLIGLIRRESREEQTACLNAIKNHYGNRISKIIKALVEK